MQELTSIILILLALLIVWYCAKKITGLEWVYWIGMGIGNSFIAGLIILLITDNLKN